jgi:hypothetical protein
VVRLPGRTGQQLSGRRGSTITIEFRTEHIAVRFQKFPKSDSGRAFARRHFVEQALEPFPYRFLGLIHPHGVATPERPAFMLTTS